jgi:hypothetical protein
LHFPVYGERRVPRLFEAAAGCYCSIFAIQGESHADPRPL